MNKHVRHEEERRQWARFRPEPHEEVAVIVAEHGVEAVQEWIADAVAAQEARKRP